MPNRIYIMIAVAILIVSPLIVNMLSSALPPPAAASNMAENDVAQVEPEPTEDEQSEAPPPPEGQIGSTEPVFDVQPSMDPAGIIPAPLAGETGSEGGPSPAPDRTPEPITIPAPDQNAPPPPPPRPEIPASLNR